MSATNPLPHPMPDETSWKEEVSKRLQQHRQKKPRVAKEQVALPMEMPEPRHADVAARVAEQYRKQLSYKEFLAAEAEAEMRRAEAAAEVAARSAQAIVAVQQQLLDELEMWQERQEESRNEQVTKAVAARPVEKRMVQEPAAELFEESARLVEADLEKAAFVDELAGDDVEFGTRLSSVSGEATASYEELTVLLAEPTVGLPTNLIEFPRQLVAAKKARPRLAEGPLREDSPEEPQLRIFEVEAELLSTVASVEHVAPEWHSIRLDASTPAPEKEMVSDYSFALPPQTASMELRVMAGLVDACLVLASFLGFVGVFVLCVHSLPHEKMLAMFGVGILGLMVLMYQWVFFSLGDQTPGMKYARIGLCTFSDENPTRKQTLMRIFAVTLSIAPLGMGYLWALVDDDRLGWHDRISRTYQRGY